MKTLTCKPTLEVLEDRVVLSTARPFAWGVTNSGHVITRADDAEGSRPGINHTWDADLLSGTGVGGTGAFLSEEADTETRWYFVLPNGELFSMQRSELSGTGFTPASAGNSVGTDHAWGSYG